MFIYANADLKNYCTIYLARHGLSLGNRLKINQGQKDYPLTEEGEQQAKDLALKLAEIKFVAVFSSDLIRAKRTAEIISQEHKLALTTTKLLRERFNGKFEGEISEELKRELATYRKIYFSLSDEEKFKFRFDPNAESDEDLMKRLIPFLREISVGFPNQNVLIVSHAGMINAFLSHLGRRDIVDNYRLPNTSFIKIFYDGVDFILDELVGLIPKDQKVSDQPLN